MDTGFVLQVKCTIFWFNIGLRVYLDLYVPDFILLIVNCTLFTAHCTMYTVQCKCTLYNVQFSHSFFFQTTFHPILSLNFSPPLYQSMVHEQILCENIHIFQTIRAFDLISKLRASTWTSLDINVWKFWHSTEFLITGARWLCILHYNWNFQNVELTNSYNISVSNLLFWRLTYFFLNNIRCMKKFSCFNW